MKTVINLDLYDYLVIATQYASSLSILAVAEMTEEGIDQKRKKREDLSLLI